MTAASEGDSPFDRLVPLVLIAVGGFLGAVLRYGLAVTLPADSLPWGTLAANVLGSFALGVVLTEGRLDRFLCPELRLLVATGFVSSFTTYSTFAAETAALTPQSAAANVGLNYGLGFAAVVCGRWLARTVDR